ncbi:MAG: hypothetical protein OXC44_07880 [Proteobacteria bacterium]|nr:hypothetical protein [Pseudomonadota bacterium]
MLRLKGWLIGCCLSFLTISSHQAYGLPINFGTTQDDLEYSEIITEHFRIYFDARVPQDGLLMAKSLEGVRPVAEKWLNVKRDDDRPLRVVTSPVTYNASFANFIFDAIELQTSQQNIRDLAWHEYIHALTYEHYKNILSPPGTIYYLLWMPAWFLEGLAEALSVSVGSDFQSGMERWQALSGHWPSYDSLHSLYLKPTWANRGYATVGAFFSWMMRDMKLKTSHSLADLLTTFRKETMPWLLPLSGFMPMNQSLRTFFKTNGQGLYTQYKQQAQAYWKAASPYSMLSNDPNGVTWKYFHKPSFQVFGKHLVTIRKSQGEEGYLTRFSFDPHSGFATSTKSTGLPLHPKATHSTYINSHKLKAMVLHRKKVAHTRRTSIAISFLSSKQGQQLPWRVLYHGKSIYDLFENDRFFGWFEKSLETFSICYVRKKTLKKHYTKNQLITPKCHNISKGPFTGKVIGFHTTWDAKNSYLATKEIWMSIEENTIAGDRYRIFIWNGKTGSLKNKPWHPFAKPVSVAFAEPHIWVLTTDRTSSYLTQVNTTSPCLSVIRFSDWMMGAWGLASGKIVLQLHENSGSSFKKIDPELFSKLSCPIPEPHSSPLLEGMRLLEAKRLYTPISIKTFLQSKNMPTLEEMVIRTHHWKPKFYKEAAEKTLQKQRQKSDPNRVLKQTNSILSPQNIKKYFIRYKALSQKTLTHKERHKALLNTPNFTNTTTLTAQPKITAKSIQPYSFRWSSPVFFPWLGINDLSTSAALQAGIITWPLVDDLQNHRVYATVLMGFKSLYPQVYVDYTNERFALPIVTRVFKQLSYNGRYNKNPKGEKRQVGLAYYDEIGGTISISDPQAIDLGRKFSVSYTLGYSLSQLNAQTGPPNMTEGLRHLPYATVRLTRYLPMRTSLSLASTVKYAPGFLNENFDYIKTLYSIRLNKALFSQSLLSLGTEYGSTRGKKPLLLKEYYTPIHIFIPGTSGVSNRFRQPIFGEQYLWRINIQGDTYLRTSAHFTTPIISDLDTQFWIFYAKKLNWSIFSDWGGIWSVEDNEKINTHPFLLAYASTIDLHLENKGVEFFLGVGIGRLHEKPVDLYLNVGFKAFL